MLDRTINLPVKLYSESPTDKFIIDYGDSTQDTINIVSSIYFWYLFVSFMYF